MKGNIMNLTTALIVPLGLGIVIAAIVFATLAGKPLPLITGPRPAMIAILVLGFAMCMGGIGQVGASGRWTSPGAIAGILLGIVLLVVIASVFTGWKLPLIQGDTQALAAVGILIAVKFVLGTAGYFFHWL